MTQKEVLKLVRATGATVSRTEFGEYRVNIKGGNEATAYYTNDGQDAIDTAWAMTNCPIGCFAPDATVH